MTRRACAAAVLLGLVALAAVPAARAQSRSAEQRERKAFLEGTHAFRRILYDAAKRGGLMPLSRQRNALAEPRRTLIVVLGDPGPLSAADFHTEGLLRGFVRAGGALLVATDRMASYGLERDFGLGVTGDLLTLTRPDDESAYRGMKECPYVRPAGNRQPNLFEPAPPVFRGDRPRLVASNLPSRLSWFWPRPLGLPVLAYLAGPIQGHPGRVEFAAGGSLGDGRALVMADHSVFINEMMLQPDNGNIDFASRLAEWLLDGPDGRRRDRVLYYEDGAVRTDFDIPLKDLPPPALPPADTLLGMLDETAHAMEEEGTFARMEEADFFNGTVEDLMRSAPFWERTEPEWKLWTLLVVAASAVLGVYAFVRLGMFRHRPEAAGPALAILLELQAPAGAVIEQRHHALLREGNVWEAAREVARQLCAAAGASPGAGPRPPALEVRGPWWRRRRVRRLWARLWRLARSDRPMRVSPGEFARLAARAEALRAALADGAVRIIH
jgi:hypothetical protein